MRKGERWIFFKNAPKLAWDIVACGRYDFNFDLIPDKLTHMPLAKRVNMLKASLNLIYRRLDPWSWPMHMQIELTNYCNLACSVCPTGTRLLERKPKAMDAALFERLFNEVSPYLITTSLWGWGEPLLHPQLSDILRLAHNRGVVTLLSTNGQNLNDVKVQKALTDYPPTHLIVALDGITDETNSKFRIGAKIAPALEGIRQLAKIKAEKNLELPSLHLRFIIMKHNEHELPQLREFATRNKFEVLTTRTLSVIDAPDTPHQELLPDNENYRAYAYNDNKRVIRSDFICQMGFTFPTVFADGTVVSCDQDFNAGHAYGSMADGRSFASIWRGNKASEVRRVIRDNPGNFSSCRECPFRDRPISTCSIQYYDLKK